MSALRGSTGEPDTIRLSCHLSASVSVSRRLVYPRGDLTSSDSLGGSVVIMSDGALRDLPESDKIRWTGTYSVIPVIKLRKMGGFKILRKAEHAFLPFFSPGTSCSTCCERDLRTRLGDRRVRVILPFAPVLITPR